MRRPIALALTIVIVTVSLSACSSPEAHRGGDRLSESAAPRPTPSLEARPHLLAIGDSIMKGHGLPPEQAWPAIIAAKRGWTLDNLACDGAGFLTTGDTGDCDETFAGLVDRAVALQPRTVIVEGSSNDFGEDNAALYAETVRDLKKLHAALPGARIIGLSTIWNDTAAPQQLAAVNGQVEAAVRSVGGRYIDVGQPLEGHPEWMQSDDVHPNELGQLAIVAAVQSAFERARFSPAR